MLCDSVTLRENSSECLGASDAERKCEENVNPSHVRGTWFELFPDESHWTDHDTPVSH